MSGTMQCELIARQAPAVDPLEVERVVEILRVAGSWLTAAEIADCMTEQGRGAPGSDRRVRAIANASGSQIISYPGSPGYRLFSQASIEEIGHAIDATKSQIRAMTAKVIAWETAYHRRGLF